ncbi:MULTISPECIES: hypothetical protein [unclassified Paenibacillus]|uniref:hypothetical protein n=1 Tax=unclassified Paenibacillus TaxID=185978 RepID=UPI0009A56877|nr:MULTISPECIES: hypothetical protein [unclassified Paenibacillus]SLK16666.1 hypothetical protein SAMN06272722_110220 [Paenibacillus sp. RU5A]SOC74434.1 hypothetical protein SAMN05880581_110220 [Paenibacillus sp. RU26A]SOC76607.1 hypothetical protein SAMN05880586_110220 [Paenibacillus sp. RU5M]
MNKLFKKYSLLARILILTTINILLFGILIMFLGYLIQKHTLIDQLHSQLVINSQEWASEINPEDVERARKEESFDDPIQTKLRLFLDQVGYNNSNIAQAYIFGVELENGRDTSIVAMPTNLTKSFNEMGMSVGAMYEQPIEVANGISSMLDSGKVTFTSFYDDIFGTWTTILYPLKDNHGDTFAYFAIDTNASSIPISLGKYISTALYVLIAFIIIFITTQYFTMKEILKNTSKKDI